MGCTSSTEATTNDTGSPLQQEPKIKKNQTTTIVHQRPSSSCRRTSSLPIYGSVRIMNPKKHGTSPTPVQNNLRWGCDYKIADKICNYNRHYAEDSGYFRGKKQFLVDVEHAKRTGTTIQFYDSNTGQLLFEAPRGEGRSHDEFVNESIRHGWPSFRDEEVHWDEVRCLRGGEMVSLAGTHLGHNLPDKKGNRYCINLVSCAGRPTL